MTKKLDPATKAARRYASLRAALDLVDDIEGSGHNSKCGAARAWLEAAFGAGVKWGRRKR